MLATDQYSYIKIISQSSQESKKHRNIILFDKGLLFLNLSLNKRKTRLKKRSLSYRSVFKFKAIIVGCYDEEIVKTLENLNRKVVIVFDSEYGMILKLKNEGEI